MKLLQIKINVARLINNFVRKVYYFLNYRKLNPNINYSKVNKILFVAHPDDEFIFLGNRLLNEDDWLVVCITNGDNIIRSNEFINLMRVLNLEFKILNFKDGPNVEWCEDKVKKLILHLLNKKEKWSLIVTHNNEGEYGHYQHKQMNKLVKEAAQRSHAQISNIEVFSHKNKLEVQQRKLPIERKKLKIEYAKNYYSSQLHVINDLERYFNYEGMDIEEL